MSQPMVKNEADWGDQSPDNYFRAMSNLPDPVADTSGFWERNIQQLPDWLRDRLYPAPQPEADEAVDVARMDISEYAASRADLGMSNSGDILGYESWKRPNRPAFEPEQPQPFMGLDMESYASEREQAWHQEQQRLPRHIPVPAAEINNHNNKPGSVQVGADHNHISEDETDGRPWIWLTRRRPARPDGQELQARPGRESRS